VTANEKEIVVMLGGTPKGVQDWAEVCREAGADMARAQRECKFTPEQMLHNRGQFPALTVGVSFGGGQTVRYRQHFYPPSTYAGLADSEKSRQHPRPRRKTTMAHVPAVH
jgi:hypothetical protein